VKGLRNSFFVGIVSGIVGTGIGTFLYWVYLRYVAESIKKFSGIDTPLMAFLESAWHNEAMNMVIAIGTIFNLAVFFTYLGLKWTRPAQGVIYATIGWLVISGALALFA
jgi:hypothetical protein